MVKRNAAEANHAFEYALGLELLRDAIRHQLSGATIAQMAARLGVGAARLRNFLDGGRPNQPLFWAALALAKESSREGEGREVDLEVVAINLIADTFPPGRRTHVRRTLLDALTPALRSLGRDTPGT